MDEFNNLKDGITVSSPRELHLNCLPSDQRRVKCSQAFPDLTRYKDRFYLAFRAAPSHFPSGQSRIHILSSDDAEEWQSEHQISGDHDLRDPHFLQFKGDLYLFYIAHSRGLFRHEPEYIYYTRHTPSGWSAPVAISKTRAGFWNIKTFNDRVYMSIYTRNGSDDRRTKRHFQLIASHDLREWQVIFNSPVTREKLAGYQTSEAAFDFDDAGNIYGTIRSVIYPNLNFMIPQDDPANWHLTLDRFKCDGPTLFRHDGHYYLIARRSFFHRLPAEPFRLFHNLRKTINVLRYSFSRKRTALYRFDHQTLQIEHIMDLPSHGDTGYSAITPLDDNRFLLIYYSSNLGNNKDLKWLQGQFDSTKLYSISITIK